MPYNMTCKTYSMAKAKIVLYAYPGLKAGVTKIMRFMMQFQGGFIHPQQKNNLSITHFYFL